MLNTLAISVRHEKCVKVNCERERDRGGRGGERDRGGERGMEEGREERREG